MGYDISKPNIWFFTTIEERNEVSTPKLRPLPGQVTLNDKGEYETINPGLDVRSKMGPRNANAIGTIFAAKKCVKSPEVPGSEVHYDASTENLIVVATGSADIKDAYAQYMVSMGGTPITPASGPASSASPIAKTFIQDILDKCPVPSIAKEGFYVDKDVWEQLLFNVKKGYNTMLVGSSGCGKTELTGILANALGMPTQIFDMAAKQDPVASLIGVHRFEEGKSIFDRADFTYALEEPKLIVLDELPR